MPDTWIDEHTGNETVARPGFKAALRAEFEEALAAPEVRRIPWKVIGWASAAAALIALVTVVVVSTNDTDRRVVPAESSPPSTDSGTPTTSDGSLRDQLVDVQWTVVTVDGVDVTAEPPPSFTLQHDGGLVGFDGCNQYGFDLSQPGGWTLIGDTLGLDQQMGSTAAACPDGLTPEIPIADGTQLALDASGRLTLTSPSGRIYVAQKETDIEPAADLLVPAEGGPDLAPIVIASVNLPTDEGPPLIALLADRIVVLPLEPFRVDGTVLAFDRAGNPMPDTRLDPVPDDPAAFALGGLDQSLYVGTTSTTDDTQTVRSYEFNGSVWALVNSITVQQNNAAVYRITGDGLMLGDQLVLPSRFPNPAATLTGWTQDGAVTQVFRTDGVSSTTTWNIHENFENLSIPSATDVFGTGVLFLGNATGPVAQQYIGILDPNGVSTFFRPNNWKLSGVSDGFALFAQSADGVVTLGMIGNAPGTAPTRGQVLGFDIGFTQIADVIAALRPRYGEPTADSGWYTATAVEGEVCMAGEELRVLHWGDLSIAFSRMFTAFDVRDEFLWSWVVGDLRGSGSGSFGEPVQAVTGTATGLQNVDGITVGSTMSELRASGGDLSLADSADADGNRRGVYISDAGAAGTADDSIILTILVNTDDVVVGYGISQPFC